MLKDYEITKVATVETTIDVDQLPMNYDYELLDQKIDYDFQERVRFNLYKKGELILEKVTIDEINDYFKE